MSEKQSEGSLGRLSTTQSQALASLASSFPQAAEVANLNGKNLTLWGVSLDGLKASSPNTKQSVVLLKFLRARKFDVQASLSMLIACLKWRREMDIDALMAEQFPAELNAGGELYGTDRNGNPVTYNYYGNLDLTRIFDGPDGTGRFVRWRVQLMERAIQQLDFEEGIEQVMQVHDYAGASMFKLSPQVKAATRTIIKLFQDNYPEMLSTKLFLNVPKIMEFAFSIMSAFSDSATRSKFQMVSSANTRATLLNYIEPARLQGRYGGFGKTDTAASGSPAPSPSSAGEAIVKAGATHRVQLDVTSAPATVSYRFVTSYYAVVASTKFVGQGAAAAEQQPATAAGEAKEEEAGGVEVTVTEPGKFVLELKNPGTAGILWAPEIKLWYQITIVPKETL
eukprot:CAMPEP_0202911340 /NCGR_PEP_ID=MMETSP1392-20130828/54700_1 /ASSEMBLY_ACC=CAM_ASM_000868 /TAXON_ID=225041 /ORGANISM="Chlamydomonas chlamydogama, Strain SAG 11-48b" /LENGTH=394 /DNA_ID=CAMNT_0049601807 /DNA_START=87 /DNA_END=1271 /DNA_ORIENTATION=+